MPIRINPVLTIPWTLSEIRTGIGIYKNWKLLVAKPNPPAILNGTSEPQMETAQGIIPVNPISEME